MSLSMYESSVPVFLQLLPALSANIDKAIAHAEARKFDPASFMNVRLAPDMFPFSRQVQLAADWAKNVTARLAGSEPRKFEDTETTMDQLKGRIASAIDYIKTFDAKQMDGSATRDITIPFGKGQTRTFKGQVYLLNLALPNFYFHNTTAYDLLRHAGVELGKRDFVGQVPA
jgi:uncharacterized protein